MATNTSDLTPVIGTPSISLIANFIIYRWTIYKKSISILRLMESHLWFNKQSEIEGKSSIWYKFFFDLYMTLVTISKNWSRMWPSSEKTSNLYLYNHWGTKNSIWCPGLFQRNRWRTCYLFSSASSRLSSYYGLSFLENRLSCLFMIHMTLTRYRGIF